MRRTRRFTRRRGSSLRWFTPNLWSGTAPQLSQTINITPAAPEVYSTVALTPLLRGSAPFQGVNNAAGLLSGSLLGERAWYNIKRIVGRLAFFARSPDVEVPFDTGGMVTVWWAIVRMNTDENGVPQTEASGNFPDLHTRDNQDDKKYILAQDVWRTPLPPATLWQENVLQNLAAEPPLYSLIDKTFKRSFRNEQDIYLATQFGVVRYNGANFQNNSTLELFALHNLRTLGTFGK